MNRRELLAADLGSPYLQESWDDGYDEAAMAEQMAAQQAAQVAYEQATLAQEQSIAAETQYDQPNDYDTDEGYGDDWYEASVQVDSWQLSGEDEPNNSSQSWQSTEGVLEQHLNSQGDPAGDSSYGTDDESSDSNEGDYGGDYEDSYGGGYDDSHADGWQEPTGGDDSTSNDTSGSSTDSGSDFPATETVRTRTLLVQQTALVHPIASGVTQRPLITGLVRASDGAPLTNALVLFDLDFDGVAEGWVNVTAGSGEFEADLSLFLDAAESSEVIVTLWATMDPDEVYVDIESPTEEFAFSHQPPPQLQPLLTAVEVLSGSSFPESEPRLIGSVTLMDQPVSRGRVLLDVDGDGQHDEVTYSDELGGFAFDLLAATDTVNDENLFLTVWFDGVVVNQPTRIRSETFEVNFVRPERIDRPPELSDVQVMALQTASGQVDRR